MKPEFITFTGVDEQTDIKELRTLASQYPVEWGVLFSPSRQGHDWRYPAGRILEDLLWARELRLAAHLCGGYSDMVMRGDNVRPRTPADLGFFKRIQVNHAEPSVDLIAGLGQLIDSRCIAQSRSLEFPSETNVDWLFDRSGGRGATPEAWPAHPGGDRLVGYAGGISPDNVADVVKAIGSTGPYWIDMESGVRTDNRFDLAKCRQVCEIVFGKTP
jgi:hypothetical protein